MRKQEIKIRTEEIRTKCVEFAFRFKTKNEVETLELANDFYNWITNKKKHKKK